MDNKVNIKIKDCIPYNIICDIKDNKLKILERNITRNGMIYYEVISINDKLNFYEKRWTLAHEVGHFFDETKLNEISPYLTRYKQEKSADKYAFETLIPESELKEKVREGWNLEELKVYFGVPEKKIKERIYQIFDKNELNFCF